MNKIIKEVFHTGDIFPAASEIFEQLQNEDDNIVPERHTRMEVNTLEL